MPELGADLIVDFGGRRSRSRSRRRPDTDGGDQVEVTATTTKKERQVSFCEDVAVRYFQYPSRNRNEVSKRWHSKRDKEIFTEQMSRDVGFIRYLLSTTPMEAVEKEALYWCVGLEAHISRRVTRYVKEKRRKHSRSIVEMQDYLSEEQLSAYAESHSSESRERAQNLAAGYLEILSNT